jgi:NAD-dependent deacetylase
LVEPESIRPRVFVLTGAGVSAESGIRTFRDGGGLWESYRIEDVASPEGFERDPELVWRFYLERRAEARRLGPNPGHVALASLEQHLGDALYLCTQNVDGLHERAGSQRVVHMHGELDKTRCSDPTCAREPFVDPVETFVELRRCACGAILRPHIVWFGEMPFELHAIKRAVQSCDVFVCIGSSGVVYPAAGLVREMHYRRSMGEEVRTVYVGLEAPENADAFDEVLLGPSGRVLPERLTEVVFRARGS